MFTNDRQTAAERQLTQNKHGKLDGPSKCLWWLDSAQPSKHCKTTTVLILPQHQQSNKSSARNEEFGFAFTTLWLPR